MTALQDVAAFIGQASKTEVDAIFDLCRARHKTIGRIAAAENLATLAPGDKVRITAGISPKYLVGATGVVGFQTAKAGSVSITLDTQVGKFSAAYPIGVPASCLTKVDA